MPVQRHVSSSSFLCIRDGYSNWIHSNTKFQMREVYTYIHINCYWYPLWKTGALRRSRPLLLATDFSKLFSRAASIEGRLADGLSTENLFFWATGLTGTRLPFFFPGLDTDQLQQWRLSLRWSSTYWTSPTSTASEMRIVVQGAASPTADDSTVSAPNHRYRVSLTGFLCHKTFFRHDVRSAITGPASTLITPQGPNSELCRTASAATTAVFNMLIPFNMNSFSAWIEDDTQNPSQMLLPQSLSLDWFQPHRKTQ